MAKWIILLMGIVMLTTVQALPLFGEIEVIAEITKPDFSGIVVTPDERIFLGFPQHAEAHVGPTLAEYRDGKLIPFPNAEWALPSNALPENHFVSPHGMTLDSLGRLWVLDDGKIAGQPIQPGAPKVVGIDLKTGEIFAKKIITSPAMKSDSHLNDLRVDLTHGKEGMVYIANSSFGTSPDLVVVDIESGKSRGVLGNHISTQNEKGYMAFLEGIPHVYDPKNPTFPVGGADGIALRKDGKTLYWTTLVGRRLYSIPTDILANMEATEEELAAAVKDEGERPATDGIAIDDENNIYFGAYEQQSIVKRKPDGQYELVAHDERFGWPDDLFLTKDYLYVTLGQWNRLPAFNNGKDLRKPPYLVVRIKIKGQSLVLPKND
ncbi:L-dopachrome tautomerase-related protein [Parachlamydia acanthamoebae]|uniref:L-dopachrome tautomerase-related protein n=1 Tax=Parachlamydia acanthamoebae TaxID=83552 RepID=UPI0007514C4A|nr:L-dopachrome tautomerase-related protein [Parachlamydia acanthamoebae]